MRSQHRARKSGRSKAHSCLALQILRYGTFYADPHCGNLAMSMEGKLIVYDFGAFSSLGQFPNGFIKDLARAFITSDASKAIQALSGMGVLDKTIDEEDAALLSKGVNAIMQQVKTAAARLLKTSTTCCANKQYWCATRSEYSDLGRSSCT